MTHDVSIVTAFFDIGRTSWHVGGRASEFCRSNEQYLRWFGNLAPLQNSMVIFTEEQFVDQVLAVRREHGLESATRVVVANDLFASNGPLAAQLGSIKRMMRPELHSLVGDPRAPEYQSAEYVVLCLLKTVFVCTAAKLGLTSSPQIAWIDFGYCRDDERFDRSKPWRFDCGGRMNMFYLREPDDRPIFDIVKTGDVYFQGCHLVGPEKSWLRLRELVDAAVDSLLTCGLVDDDQTALLMAYRREPGLFRIHHVDPSDWFVIFRKFHHPEDNSTIETSSTSSSTSTLPADAGEIREQASVNGVHSAVAATSERVSDQSQSRLTPFITGKGREDVLLAARSLASGGKIVEVGTFKAEFAERLFEACDPSKMYCVDPYSSYEGYWDISDSPKALNEIFEEARARMGRFGERVEFVKAFSSEAAKQFADDSLDLIYIDGNHSFRFVLDDLRLWYAKARSGALICGDDAVDTDEQRRDTDGNVEIVWLRNDDGTPRSAGRYGVLKALKAFCSERAIDFHLSGSQYFLLKQ